MRTESSAGGAPGELELDDLAGSYALRKAFKRSRVSSRPGLHAGVGLSFYSRVTSPLRRYLDLVAHQQLRLFLSGQPVLDEGGLLERLGASEASISDIAQAEALSRRHWTLVYLLQHPGWQGEAVLVDLQGLRGRVLIPKLALEETVHLRRELPLNARFPVTVRGVNLAELEAHFALEAD
jgi:exoribonuclease-2